MAEASMSSLSRPRAALPDPTLLLFLMAGLLVWSTQMADPTTSLTLAGVALLPLALWLLYSLSSSAHAGIALLVVASALPRGSVAVVGLNMRPEHLAVGLLCLALPLLLRRRPQPPVLWMVADYALVAYVGMNVFSSLFASPAPQQTLRWSMQQTLAILPYFFLRLLAADERRFRWAFRTFLLVGALEAAYGLLAYYSNLLFATDFGLNVDFYGSIPAPYGTQFEPNIFAAYCGTFSVAMLAMFLAERRRIYLLGYVVTLSGMAVGMSRAALGATLIAMLLLAYCSRRLGWLDGRALRSVAFATLCVVVLVLPAVAANYIERLSAIDVSDPTADANTFVRVVQSVSAVDDIVASPLLGHGTASFQLLYAEGESFVYLGDDAGWIGNTGLRVLHDTGLIGFAAFVVFLVSLSRRALRRLRQALDPVLLALLVSAAVYVVAFQFTEGTILAFPWVHLGLLACAVSLAEAADRANVPPVGERSSR